MPKEEWGTKRVCPTSGKRFYDMNRDPIVSPYTGETVTFANAGKTRTMVADKPDANTVAKDLADQDDVVLDDDDSTDVDLGDDVLDDDDDEENVSLEEIADVPANDDD